MPPGLGLGCPEAAQMLYFLIVVYLSGDGREKFLDFRFDGAEVFLYLLVLEIEVEFLAQGLFAVAGDETQEAGPG